jgi:hypothetical protein
VDGTRVAPETIGGNPDWRVQACLSRGAYCDLPIGLAIILSLSPIYGGEGWGLLQSQIANILADSNVT